MHDFRMIRNDPAHEAPRPDFFIVGAPKSGTTSMWAYLRAHPQIYMPRTKEPHRFGSDLEFTDRITDDEYIALFSGATPEQRIGEASVWYLYSERAALEIREFSPEARIIIMLRNPVDMIHSLHHEVAYQGTETIQDFEAALEAESDGPRSGMMPFVVRPPKVVSYRSIGSYSSQVGRYLALFGARRVHVIIFEEFAGGTATVCEETLRFLEVDPTVVLDLPLLNRSKGARSKTIHRLLHEPPPRVRRVVRRLLPQRVRFEVGAAIKNANRRHDPRAPMSRQLRSELIAHFAPDIERLEDLIGRDLSAWKEARSTQRSP